jgi:uncharacterized protein (TIGR02118 family)
MINAVNLLRRRPGMSVDAFQTHWRTEHAELIVQLPGVIRYVQSHPLPETYEAGDPVYDGVAELWANGSQAFRNIGASDVYKAVQADEEKFLDRAAIGLVLTDERIVKEGAVSNEAVKCIRFLKRAPNISVDDFQSQWRDDHGPKTAALPSVIRYAQYPARLGGYAKGREPAYDGFDITWHDSADTIGEASIPDGAAFLARDACRQLLTREIVIHDPS